MQASCIAFGEQFFFGAYTSGPKTGYVGRMFQVRARFFAAVELQQNLDAVKVN